MRGAADLLKLAGERSNCTMRDDHSTEDQMVPHENDNRFRRFGDSVLACLLATAPGDDDSEGGSIATASPFKGKLIVINSKGRPEVGVVLENAKAQRLGERHFLVGISADGGNPDNWTQGKLVWIAMDDIGIITEFSSADELKSTLNVPAGPRGKKSQN